MEISIAGQTIQIIFQNVVVNLAMVVVQVYEQNSHDRLDSVYFGKRKKQKALV
jgi:hypothetical protein